MERLLAVDEDSFLETKVFPDMSLPVILLDFSWGGGRTLLRHRHDPVEILRFREGTMLVDCGKRQLAASAGDILVIPGGVSHAFRSVTAHCENDCLIIDKDWLLSCGVNFDHLSFDGLIGDKGLYARFDRICKLHREHTPYSKLELYIEILTLIRELMEHAQQNSVCRPYAKTAQVQAVNEALAYIRAHLCEPLTVEEVCRQVNFSKSHFCRVYRAVTGMTVVQTINELRCHMARQLLLNRNCTVAQCAKLCGFSGVSYFTRVYKSVMGHLPSETVEKQ